MNPKSRALEVSKEKKALIEKHAEGLAKNLRRRIIRKSGHPTDNSLMTTLSEEDINEPRVYREKKLTKI